MFKKLKLQQRITLLIVFLVLLIVLQISFLFYFILTDTVEGQIGKRALHVATTVANMPEIRSAFNSEKPWVVIQPIVEKVRIEIGAEYIVVGNKQGVRYSHPIPERIGKEMVGGDNTMALVYGQSYVSKAVGSLGPSLRGKVPIWDEKGEIVGVVSVGFLMEDIKEMAGTQALRILWIAVSGIALGILGSIYLAGSIKKTMFGLEPEEISSLYQQRDAVIQSVREGIMVVNKRGEIVLVNQAAYEILSLSEGKEVIGQPVMDVIPNTSMLEVLQNGEQQLDRQMVLSGKDIIANRLPVLSGDSVIGVVSSFRLKSEMDQLSEELSQIKRYTEALRAQTHEYNNLLYTLSGLIQLESYQEALELIHKETAIHQDFVQFVMQKLKDPTLGGILLGFYNRAKELKVEFILDRDSSLRILPEHMESNNLVYIIGNLITNAFEAVQNNDPHNKKVRLFVTDIGDDLLIEVEDSGLGVSDELLPLLFQRGFTTKAGEKRGYGLAKIKELVDELGGDIAIEEGDLGGALFIVAIPKERKV